MRILLAFYLVAGVGARDIVYNGFEYADVLIDSSPVAYGPMVDTPKKVYYTSDVEARMKYVNTDDKNKLVAVSDARNGFIDCLFKYKEKLAVAVRKNLFQEQLLWGQTEIAELNPADDKYTALTVKIFDRVRQVVYSKKTELFYYIALNYSVFEIADKDNANATGSVIKKASCMAAHGDSIYYVYYNSFSQWDLSSKKISIMITLEYPFPYTRSISFDNNSSMILCHEHGVWYTPQKAPASQEDSLDAYRQVSSRIECQAIQFRDNGNFFFDDGDLFVEFVRGKYVGEEPLTTKPTKPTTPSTTPSTRNTPKPGPETTKPTDKPKPTTTKKPTTTATTPKDLRRKDPGSLTSKYFIPLVAVAIFLLSVFTAVMVVFFGRGDRTWRFPFSQGRRRRSRDEI